jgi:hypothetical protein
MMVPRAPNASVRAERPFSIGSATASVLLTDPEPDGFSTFVVIPTTAAAR